LKQLRIGLLAILLFGATAGCGGGERETTISHVTSSLVVYRYTAVVESYVDIWAPFPAAVGDVITGTFTYDPGAAAQKPPAGVQVKIGDVTLTSNLDTFTTNLGLLNAIHIRNDSQHVSPDGVVFNSGDHFDWFTHDTSTGASFGADGIGVGIALQDTTGTVFSDSTIPTQLNLNRFDNAFIQLSKEVSGVGTFVFCRALVTSLNRLQ